MIVSWRKASLILVDPLNPHQKMVHHLCPYSLRVGSCVRASACPDCLPVRMICIAWCNIYIVIHNDFRPLLSACETSAWCVMRQAEWVCIPAYIYIYSFTNRELCIEIWTHSNNKMNSFHYCGYCWTPMTTCSLLKKNYGYKIWYIERMGVVMTTASQNRDKLIQSDTILCRINHLPANSREGSPASCC